MQESVQNERPVQIGMVGRNTTPMSPEGLAMFVLRSMSMWLSLVSFSSFLSAHINLKVQNDLAIAHANRKLAKLNSPPLLDVLIFSLNLIVKFRPKGHHEVSGV